MKILSPIIIGVFVSTFLASGVMTEFNHGFGDDGYFENRGGWGRRANGHSPQDSNHHPPSYNPHNNHYGGNDNEEEYKVTKIRSPGKYGKSHAHSHSPSYKSVGVKNYPQTESYDSGWTKYSEDDKNNEVYSTPVHTQEYGHAHAHEQSHGDGWNSNSVAEGEPHYQAPIPPTTVVYVKPPTFLSQLQELVKGRVQLHVIGGANPSDHGYRPPLVNIGVAQFQQNHPSKGATENSY